MSRIHLFILGGILMAGSAKAGVAQQSEGRETLAGSFAQVSDLLLESAEMVPADRYAERPVASVRTFLQLVTHVADGNRYYCEHAKGNAIEWDDPNERTTTSRDAAIAALSQSIDDCKSVYESATAKESALIEGLAHANLHYGNVITYLRVMGLVPPSR